MGEIGESLASFRESEGCLTVYSRLSNEVSKSFELVLTAKELDSYSALVMFGIIGKLFSINLL